MLPPALMIETEANDLLGIQIKQVSFRGAGDLGPFRILFAGGFSFQGALQPSFPLEHEFHQFSRCLTQFLV